MIGGYLIIDFGGYEFATDATPEVFPGIYKKIKKANKPLLIRNFNLDGQAIAPFFCQHLFDKDNNNVCVVNVDTSKLVIMLITDDDEVGVINNS